MVTYWQEGSICLCCIRVCVVIKYVLASLHCLCNLFCKILCRILRCDETWVIKFIWLFLTDIVINDSYHLWPLKGNWKEVSAWVGGRIREQRHAPEFTPLSRSDGFLRQMSCKGCSKRLDSFFSTATGLLQIIPMFWSLLWYFVCHLFYMITGISQVSK